MSRIEAKHHLSFFPPVSKAPQKAGVLIRISWQWQSCVCGASCVMNQICPCGWLLQMLIVLARDVVLIL